MAAAVTVVETSAVDLTRLETALCELWKDLERQDRERPLSRALTLNLVGVWPDGDRRDAQHTLARLLLRHPCRALVLMPETSGGRLRASLVAQARPDGFLGRRLVLEQVTLAGGSSDLERAPGLVRPLLLSDLPTCLFWNGPLPPDARALRPLARLADRVIVDSSRFVAPAADLDRLQAGLGPHPLDLSWFRVRPWRRALAEAFEHLAWQQGDPVAVDIGHGPHPGAVAASHLLAQWLRARLAANVQTRPVAVPEPELLEPAVLDLAHGHDKVVVRHEALGLRLRVDVTRQDHCLLPFHLPGSRGSRGDLLAAAVDQR